MTAPTPLAVSTVPIVYNGRKPSGSGTQVSPSIRALGLELVRSQPTDIEVVSISSYVTPAFRSYVAHLPAFIQATLGGKDIPLTYNTYPIPPVSLTSCIPIPDISVGFQVGKESPKLFALLNNRSHQVHKDGKNTMYILHHFTSEDAKLVKDLELVSRKNPPFGISSYQGYSTLAMVRKLLHGFLLTHRYPAILDESHYETILVNLKTEDMKGGDDEERFPKRRRLMVEKDGMEVEPGKNHIQLMLSGTIQLSKARYSTVPETRLPYCSMDRMPSANGLYFAYVPDLAIEDTRVVPDFIKTHLLLSLGTSKDECLSRFMALKGGWTSAATTLAGKILTHVFWVMGIALEVEGIITCHVENDQYKGCLLSGSGFAVCVDRVSYGPKDVAIVTKAVEDQDVQSKTLSQLARLLLDDKVKKVESMRELVEFVTKAPLTIEHRNEVMELLPRLTFGPYARVTYTSIREALHYIIHPDDPIPLTYPASHELLNAKTRAESVLCCFGLNVPSLRVANGVRYKIRGAEKTKWPRLIGTSMSNLTDAAKVWVMCLDEGILYGDPSNLSGPNQNRLFTKEQTASFIEEFLTYTRPEAPEKAQTTPAVVPHTKTAFDDLFD